MEGLRLIQVNHQGLTFIPMKKLTENLHLRQKRRKVRPSRKGIQVNTFDWNLIVGTFSAVLGFGVSAWTNERNNKASGLLNEQNNKSEDERKRLGRNHKRVSMKNKIQIKTLLECQEVCAELHDALLSEYDFYTETIMSNKKFLGFPENLSIPLYKVNARLYILSYRITDPELKTQLSSYYHSVADVHMLKFPFLKNRPRLKKELKKDIDQFRSSLAEKGADIQEAIGAQLQDKLKIKKSQSRINQ